MLPIFSVWLRSSAASISSRMYMGAGLKSSSDRMSDSTSSERCPRPAGQLAQGVLPAVAEAHQQHQPVENGAALGRVQLRLGVGQQRVKMELQSGTRGSPLAHVILSAWFTSRQAR